MATSATASLTETHRARVSQPRVCLDRDAHPRLPGGRNGPTDVRYGGVGVRRSITRGLSSRRHLAWLLRVELRRRELEHARVLPHRALDVLRHPARHAHGDVESDVR